MNWHIFHTVRHVEYSTKIEKKNKKKTVFIFAFSITVAPFFAYFILFYIVQSFKGWNHETLFAECKKPQRN